MQSSADVASLCLAVWRFERVRLEWDHRFPQNLPMQFKFVGERNRANFDEYIADFKAAITSLNLYPAE
jgi:hypothetical protein